jgi:hypothetical protein
MFMWVYTRLLQNPGHLLRALGQSSPDKQPAHKKKPEPCRLRLDRLTNYFIGHDF